MNEFKTAEFKKRTNSSSEYTLKSAIIKAGVELKAGDKVELTISQAESLKKAGVV